MNVFHLIKEDWKENKSNIKAQLILCLFRLSQFFRKLQKPYFYLTIPYLILYRFIVEWVLGIELSWNTKVGRGLKLYHGQSLVVNDKTILGNYCTLRQNTTIGHKELEDGTFSDAPIIGDFVDIGANVVIIGAIVIGNNIKIGAGSVVTKDLPSNGIYVGNPAKLLKKVYK